MIHLGTQYYRPPFPKERYWEEDIRRMAESGLNTIQLWVVWGWVEAEPGHFRYEDYDRIIELAGQHGLEVVLSTIAAIHPYWIHRLVPGSEMVTNEGLKVVSSNRRECHFGLTPGGCLDHPGVWERMRRFLRTTAARYRDVPHLFGWDAWNELRWNVQADALVCYCPNTLNRFRAWLKEKYGGLEELNAAWVRRYSSWEDVFPGKHPNRPYTEMMAFQEFITWRAVQHAYDRYATIKAVDGEHPVTVHGGQPTVLHGSDSYPLHTSLHRGNDWDFAERVDGIGCSSFPLWGGIEMERAQFINRIDFVASAAGKFSAGEGVRLWLSELQGGRSNVGFEVAQSVPAVAQQNWVWTGLSNGAEAILFWCWRDEVFGRETTGFGLAGNDGLAPERLDAMQETGQLLQQHGDLLQGFQPEPAQVGIFFSPQSYYLYWAQEGTAQKALDGIRGYARALVRHQIPYRIVEEAHLEDLEGLKFLILPRIVVMADAVAERLADFARAGGVILFESEVGAFGTNGIYRYPEDRFFAELTGVQEVGRRRLEGDTVTLSAETASSTLPATQWKTPMRQGESAETSLWHTVALGEGLLLFCGTYLGDAYLHSGDSAFEHWLRDLVGQAGVQLPARVVQPQTDAESFVHVRVGHSRERTLAFVFAPQSEDTVILTFPKHAFGAGTTELLSGREVFVEHVGDDEARITLGPTPWGVSVLVSEEEA